MIKILTKKDLNRKVIRQTRILIENISERKEYISEISPMKKVIYYSIRSTFRLMSFLVKICIIVFVT
jgi:hypothetical protein